MGRTTAGMKRPELLAPAGSFEALEAALDFGANAVYVAGPRFGLRAYAPNFTLAELRRAVDLAHACGSRLYVAMNALVHEDDVGALHTALSETCAASPDGIIFSDPAVLAAVSEAGLTVPLHLSTQASTLNSEACRFWFRQGVRRIVLGREATLDQIRTLRRRIPVELELETFVHGAMCMAYSGRCFLSAQAVGRSGNRGECAQPCRWAYEVREKGTDTEFQTVVQHPDGSYIFNARDLMMLEHLPELVEAGVTSLKIEGRMKSAYYVASVVSVYRRALDDYWENGIRPSAELTAELTRSATRPFTTGFYFGPPGPDGQDRSRKDFPRRYTFVARVLGEARDGYIEIEQRNKFAVGEELEVLSPAGTSRRFVVRSLKALDGTERMTAPHPQEHLLIECPWKLNGGEFLRRLDESVRRAHPYEED